MPSRSVTRKDFLRLSAAVGAGALVSACGAPAETPTTAPQATTKPAAETTKPAATAAATAAPTAAPTAAAKATEPAKPAAQAATAPAAASGPSVQGTKYNVYSDTKPTKYREAPMLAERVKAGKLPPVEQRLPEEPLVIKPIEIGTYGGTIRTGNPTPGRFWYADTPLIAGGPRIQALRYTPDLTGYVPCACKALKISDDKTTFTLTMRKGMKWSSGEPLTSKDFMFWYEDILQNKDVVPSIAPQWRQGGKLMEVTAPDDYTIVIKFAAPAPSFALSYLPHSNGWTTSNQFHPAYYLKKFHAKYNTNAAADAKAAKYESWSAWLLDKSNMEINPERPTLSPYIVTSFDVSGNKMERNPYYWAVDTEGNQLPYVDYHVAEYVQTLEMYTTKIVTGTYDFAAGRTAITDYTALVNGAKQGNYEVILWNSGKASEVFFNVNMTSKDPVLRKIHQDVRYRRALSLAIDRDEINTTLYVGKAIPRQITCLRSCKLWKPEFEKAWAQYDVKQANALLDEMGLKWNGDKTVRLRPDGEPLKYTFSYNEIKGIITPLGELVLDYWRKIGIDASFKQITRQLLGPRILANDEPMSLWEGDVGTEILLPADRKWTSAKYGDESTMAPLWGQWYDTEGKQGEEPPDWFKPVFEAFTKYRDTMDPQWGQKLLQLQADNIWSIGTVAEGPWPVVRRKTLKNVPDYGIYVWDGQSWWPFYTECVFFKQ